MNVSRLLRAGMLWTLAVVVAAGCTPAPPAAPTAAPTGVPAAKPTGAPPPPTQAAGKPTAAPAPAVKAGTKITGVIGTQGKQVNFLPLFLAQEKKYFEAEGLDVEWITADSGGPAMTALLTGQAQINAGGMTAVASAVGNGQNVRAFAPLASQVAFSLIMRNDSMAKASLDPKAPLAEKVKRLKGLKIGTSGPGSGTDQALRYLLAQYGVDPERDVELVPMNSTIALSALAGGQVYGTIYSPPVPEQQLATGKAARYINLAEEVPIFGNQINQALIARSDYMEQHPEVVLAVTRAISRALHDLRADPESSKKLLQEKVYSALAPDVWELVWSTYQKTLFPPDAVMTEEQVLNVIRLDNAVKNANVQIPFDRLATNTFAQQAKAALGY